MNNFLHADRSQQNRRRQTRAKHFHAQVALRNIPQHSRYDSPAVERFAVRTHGVFAARPARNIVVRPRRKDFLRLLLQQMQRHGHRRFSEPEPECINLQLALCTCRHCLRLFRIAHVEAGLYMGEKVRLETRTGISEIALDRWRNKSEYCSPPRAGLATRRMALTAGWRE